MGLDDIKLENIPRPARALHLLLRTWSIAFNLSIEEVYDFVEAELKIIGRAKDSTDNNEIAQKLAAEYGCSVEEATAAIEEEVRNAQIGLDKLAEMHRRNPNLFTAAKQELDSLTPSQLLELCGDKKEKK